MGLLSIALGGAGMVIGLIKEGFDAKESEKKMEKTIETKVEEKSSVIRRDVDSLSTRVSMLEVEQDRIRNRLDSVEELTSHYGITR